MVRCSISGASVLVVKRLLTHGIRKVINQLKEMNADHEFQRIRLSAAFAFTVIRAYQRFQVLPRNDAV